MSRRVFITGASGFIGSHLARRSLKQGDMVGILARPTSDLWRLADCEKDLERFKGDILDKSSLGKALQQFQPTAIFHMANAGVYDGQSVSDRQQIETNLAGLMNLLEAAETIPYTAFINGGSSAEYGPKEQPMREADVCEPAIAYAVAKLAATSYARYYGQTKSKPVLTLRIFSPYGPYDDHRRFVSATALKLIRGQALELADPKAVRDFIYIDDLVDALVAASQGTVAQEHPGEVINVGSGAQHSLEEVLKEIQKAADLDTPVAWGTHASRSWESAMWQADISKAKSMLGFAPRHSLAQGIVKTVSWFKENESEYPKL